VEAKKMNDNDREDWINNDESLYVWWKGTGQGITTFVRENRAELTKYINRALNRKPKS
jgi:hypothetical protein